MNAKREADEHRFLLNEVQEFLDRYNDRTIGDTGRWEAVVKDYREEIAADPKTNEQVFEQILERMNGSEKRHALGFVLMLGLKCPEGLVSFVKSYVENDLEPNGHLSMIEFFENRLGFTGEFTKEQRNQLFADEDIRGSSAVLLRWNTRAETYSIIVSEDGALASSEQFILLPPDRQTAEAVFEKIQNSPTGIVPGASSRTERLSARVRTIVDTIIPDVLNKDQYVLEKMLNVRSVKELEQLEGLSTQDLGQLTGAGAGRDRMWLLRNYRLQTARIDEDENEALALLRADFQAGNVPSRERRTREEGIQGRYALERKETEEAVNVALRHTFDERNERVRGMIGEGLLDVRLEGSALRLRPVEGRQDAVQDRAFELAIKKQNAKFFAAKEGEEPQETRTRILGDLKKRIEDRFVTLQRSREKDTLRKSEPQQGEIGLGRLFEGLFEGENGEYLRELLADKDYVKSLLFQYRTGDYGDPERGKSRVEHVPVSPRDVDGQYWRRPALAELVALHRKHFPEATDVPIATVMDQIHQEVEQELRAHRRRNDEAGGVYSRRDASDPNYGHENPETARFDRWKTATHLFGLRVPFDQLPGVTATDIERITAPIELMRDSIDSADYVNLYERTFGKERLKQLFMEVMAPELILDEGRRNEYTRFQGGPYSESNFWQPRRMFGMVKELGVADLKGARAMAKEMARQMNARKEGGKYIRSSIDGLRSGVNEAYSEEIEALLDAAGV